MKKVLLALFVLLTLSTSVFAKGKPVEKIVNDLVSQTQPALPIQVDEATYLWGFDGDETSISYFYMLKVPSTQLDIDFFTTEMEKIVLDTVVNTTDPTIKKFKKAGLSFNHIYYGVDGVLVSNITITPEDYQK